jgi:hypothetical protein
LGTALKNRNPKYFHKLWVKYCCNLVGNFSTALFGDVDDNAENILLLYYLLLLLLLLILLLLLLSSSY